jgi:hypothetical protein
VSFATYDTPIPAVPDIPPSAKARFAALLFMRDAANRAFDKATALPRSATGWVVSLLHRWVEATDSARAFLWLGEQARDATSLLRTAGVVPSALAVLSTPPVAAAAVRAAKFLGRGMVRIAKVAWTGIESVLGQWGSTGTLITESLTHTGTQIVEAVMAVAKHPMMKPVIQAFKATLALVRPVSQGFVTNRLLAAFVPVLWLRAMIAFLLMPVLVDPSLVSNIWDWASTPSDSEPTNTEGTEDAQDDLLINTFGIGIPTPSGKVPSDHDQVGVTEQADPNEADAGQHLNRASRRAKQREDAHARRTQYQFS